MSVAGHPGRGFAAAGLLVAAFSLAALSPAAADDPKELSLDLGQGVKLELVLVPAGTFTMGERGLAEEGPLHEVTISKTFYMGKYEVTQEQYQTLMGSNPSHFKLGPKNPVESLSWDKAKEFCAKLGEKTGRGDPKRLKSRWGTLVRLPTEAEWEYACRAGTRTTYSSGNDVESLRKVGWISPTGEALADAPTKPVGSFLPNAFGLYDMHGNVYEWCQDWFDPTFYANSPKVDPVNLKEFVPPGRKEAEPVLRGGSAGSPPGKARAAYRNHYNRIGKHTIGFRVVVEAASGGK